MTRRGSFEASDWSRRRGLLLDLLIVVSGVVLTAAFSLVLEDLLPNHAGRMLDWLRWAVVIVAAAALWLMLWLRRGRFAGRGTLYYVRALDAAMSDGHLENFERAGKYAHSDVRVVARWLTQRPDNGSVVDVAEDIAELGRALQQTMNDDDFSTAFNLAPNMLYPTALAFGYDLFWWPGSLLEEAPTSDGSGQRPGLSWQMPLADKHEDAGKASQRYRGFSFGESPAFSGEPTLGTYQTTGSGDTGSCLVTVRLTPGRELYQSGLPTRYLYDVCIPCGPVADDEVPRDSRAVSLQIEAPHPARRPTSPDGAPQVAVHPGIALKTTVSVIRLALHEHHDSPVLLYLRMPKTLGVAVGWGLANIESELRCTDEACLYPWRRLIPLLYGQGADVGRVLIHRVHPSQPPAGVLARRARSGVIDLSGEACLREKDLA